MFALAKDSSGALVWRTLPLYLFSILPCRNGRWGAEWDDGPDGGLAFSMESSLVVVAEQSCGGGAGGEL